MSPTKHTTIVAIAARTSPDALHDAAVDYPDDPVTMSAALAMCWRMLASNDTLAMQLSELGDIELPPDTRSAVDVALIQSATPLYLAAELESARLISAVETLASLSISGGLPADIGPASALLYRFWQRRNDRFNEVERRAFFARLFGTPTETPLSLAGSSNTAFPGLMIDVTEAIYQIEPMLAYGNVASFARLRLAAQRLASNIGQRAGGLAGFAGRDLVRTVQESLDILKHAPLQRALGARDVWSAVQSIARLYLHEDVDVASHVRRAKAGTVILAWIAEVLPRIDDHATPPVREGDPVLSAAATWLEASLVLEDAQHIQRDQYSSRMSQ